MSETRPQRKTTIMVELKIENQWIWWPKKLADRSPVRAMGA